MVGSVQVDTRQMERDIARLSKEMISQVPFATALALTQTAWMARSVMPEQMRKDLDRPRPFTAGMGAVFVKKANKADLTATVGFKDIQARYMQYQIGGGQRRQKGYEKFLQGIGALPAGWVTTPGPGAPIDAYGNIRQRELSAMLASLQRGIGQYKASGRGKKRSMQLQAFFVAGATATDPRVKNLPPGVFQRLGVGRRSRIVPWLFFVKTADYSPDRFDFQALVNEVVGKQFDDQFRAALERATRTAR